MTLRVPPAPGRTRNNARSILEAKALHEGGWSCRRIAAMFGVSDTTVLTWVNPEYATRARTRARNLERRKNAERTGGRLAHPQASPEFREARIRSLRSAGLSCNAIAKTMTFDFPDHPLTVNQVRYMLGEKGAV